MKALVFGLLLLTGSTWGCTAECDMPPENTATTDVTSTISGLVYDMYTGDRVSFARVQIQGTTQETLCDSLGQFSFRNVTPGEYTLHVNKDNFGNGNSHPIHVRERDSLYSKVGLRPIAGEWYLTILWDGNREYLSSFQLDRDGTLLWNAPPDRIPGTWTLKGDSLYVDFSNGTMLDGIVRDSATGLVDQRDYPINGTFFAIR